MGSFGGQLDTILLTLGGLKVASTKLS